MSDRDLSHLSMLELFCMEVRAQVAMLNEGLLTLESQSASPEVLASVMRAAHSIKGAARMVHLQAAVAIAHAMEDCLVAARAGAIALTSAHIDGLLQGADLLQSIAERSLADPAYGVTPEDPEVQDLVATLGALMQAESAKSPTAEPLPEFLPEAGVTPSAEQLPELPLTEAKETTPTDKFAPESLEVWQAEAPPLEEVLPPAAIASSSLTVPSWEGVSEPIPMTAEVISRGDPSAAIANRVVRVSAENLNRLMGLAGESLVEANWLEPFADSLLKLKASQQELYSHLEQLQEMLRSRQNDPRLEEQCSLTLQKANDCRQILSDRQSELDLFARRSSSLADRLYREVISTHMRPFGDSGQGFPRLVRDLAKRLGKRVRLEMIGKSVLVDRDILEKLEVPLTHLLQNAIDHGIEPPEVRLAHGKPAEGTVRIEAVHRAGMLSITISDDGCGIDLERLRAQVIARNLTAPEMADRLSEPELMEFLFLPGFSTVQAVTDVSGRGVGLDVVQSVVQEVGGTLRATSQLGQGMSFHLQLPLTLSVIRTLLVEISGEPYAFPLTRIDRVLMLSRSEISLSENHPFFVLNRQSVGLVPAYQVLQLPPPSVESEVLTTVVISDRLSRCGLIVDRLLGEHSLVVRPIDPRLGKVANISAAALLEDGSPVLIVDVEDLVRSIDNLLVSGKLGQINPMTHPAIAKTHKRVLVVDDSITVREMERKLLENKGYQVEVAVNGMDGWNAVRSGHYDLVVTDIDMPRMNGIELVNQIKSHANLKQTPVIIVSYKDRDEDKVQGLDAGADYYLTKSSFHDDTLLRAVIDLIGEA